MVRSSLLFAGKHSNARFGRMKYTVVYGDSFHYPTNRNGGLKINASMPS